MLVNDHGITETDIVDLRSPRQLADFFARLGYVSSVASEYREALKEVIHDEKLDLQNQIQELHQLVRRHDAETGTDFFVYLYVLSALNKTTMQEIVKDLGKKSAEFLLVLTDKQYDRLDFVYIDRTTGTLKVEGGGQLYQSTFEGWDALKMVRVGKVQPRVLSIERKSPSKIALRVLNRFFWPQKRSVITQCKILRSAYEVLEWSEEYFNNHALFSDHYLLNILPEEEQGVWQASVRGGGEAQTTQVYRRLRNYYDDAAQEYAEKSEQDVRRLLIAPVLTMLDFAFTEGNKSEKVYSTVNGERRRVPDYTLFTKNPAGERDEKVAVCLAYKWGRSLDGYEDLSEDDQKRDLLGEIEEDSTVYENPGAVVVTLLDQEKVDWALLTNGKTWRLYSAKAHNRATNYYEIDLEETLAMPVQNTSEALKTFLYFWLLFRADAFIPRRYGDRQEPLTFLDHLLKASSEYALQLGNSLKDNIFERVFAHFAEGLIHYVQSQGSLPPNLGLLTEDQRNELLKPFFISTLTFLYRVLFVLYAESRNLLPVYERNSYYPHSLYKLKEEVAEVAGSNKAQSKDKIEHGYLETSFVLYDRLLELFRAIDKGNAEFNVPTYNGGLFVTSSSIEQPAKTEGEWMRVVESLKPEELVTYVLANYKISDRQLAFGLDEMARGEDQKSHKLMFVDYKSLGVRQLGSIYEGLLEFKLRYAVEELAIIKGKYVPISQAGSQYKEGKTPTIKAKKAYIENDRHERKATGSYYTPDYIVEYIVEQTVGPIMDEKEKVLLPKMRQAQHDVLQMQKRNKDLKNQGNKPEGLAPTYNKYTDLFDQFFDIKVVDPAMGSGHFLVEAVDYITRRMIKILDKVPYNPVRYQLKNIQNSISESMERQGIAIDSKKLTEINLLKRHVLKRCIYGVDLNLMAVELAKVSVWLDSFTLGAPLSFLDHHMRWGNSLLGVRIDDVNDKVENGQLSLWFGDSLWVSAALATKSMIEVGRLNDVTVDQAQDSHTKYQGALKELEPYKRLLNIYASRWYSNPWTVRKKDNAVVDKAIDFLRSPNVESWIKSQDASSLTEEQKIVMTNAIKDAEDRQFFHWELEFPEVFIDLEKAEVKKDGGFDAVVGNPPYVRQEGLGKDKVAFNAIYKVFNSIADLYTYFIERGNVMLRSDGRFSMITANKFMRANYGAAVRSYLIERVKLERLVDFGDLPVFGDATTYPIILITQKTERHSNPIEYALINSLAFDKLKPVVDELTNKMPDTCFNGNNWTLSSYIVQSIFDKLSSKHLSMHLSDYARDKVQYGIKTGFNEAFVIDKITRNELIQEDINSEKIIKPLLVGEDVKRYSLWPKNQYLIFTRRGIDIKQYPAIERYLSKYREQLEPKPIKWDDQVNGEWPGRKSGSYKWYEIQDNIAYYLEFEKPKIIYPNICMQPEFAYDEEGYYSNQKTFIISVADTYLLSVLNSKIMKFIFNIILPKLRGNFFEPGYVFMKNVPIRRINFMTPEYQRMYYQKKSKQLYAQFVSDNNRDDVLDFVRDRLAEEPEASDVVHDLLGYLAEEMLRLNKEKQALQRSLIDLLVNTLRIQPQPDKDGKVGIDALKNKSQVLNYVGDYQKDEKPLAWDVLKAILRANKNRCMVYQSESLFAQLEDAYMKNLAQMQPIKDQLKKTDWLIDQIVYRLYGLTEEEMKVVDAEVAK